MGINTRIRNDSAQKLLESTRECGIEPPGSINYVATVISSIFGKSFHFPVVN